MHIRSSALERVFLCLVLTVTLELFRTYGMTILSAYPKFIDILVSTKRTVGLRNT